MVETARRRVPALVGDLYPKWYHPRGDKVRVENLDMRRHVLELGSRAVQVRITRMVSTSNERWIVEWKIRFSQRLDYSQGRLVMSRQLLRRIFGLDGNGEQERSTWLLDRYGADAGEPGFFLRWGDYVNIPGPGTGHDGDANVSIEIYPFLTDCLTVLLAAP